MEVHDRTVPKVRTAYKHSEFIHTKGWGYGEGWGHLTIFIQNYLLMVILMPLTSDDMRRGDSLQLQTEPPALCRPSCSCADSATVVTTVNSQLTPTLQKGSKVGAMARRPSFCGAVPSNRRERHRGHTDGKGRRKVIFVSWWNVLKIHPTRKSKLCQTDV